MNSETHAAPEAPAPAQPPTAATPPPPPPLAAPGTPPKKQRRRGKQQRKQRDGWSLLEKFFGLLTALLTLVTAAIGLWGLNAASERDDLKEETSTLADDTADLEAERDELAADLEEANGRIEELEAEQDDPVVTTPSDDDSTTAPRTPGSRGQLLTDLEAVSGGAWSVKEGIYVNEGFHDQALVSSSVGFCGLPVDRTVEYSLRSQYETLTASVGVTEGSDAGFPVRVDVFGDDNELWTGTVQVSQKQDVTVDVTGVIRLRIVVTRLFEHGDTCESVAAALGDPTLN